MSYGAKAVQAANNRCFVGETPIAGGHWFAQVETNTAPSDKIIRNRTKILNPGIFFRAGRS